MQRKKVVLSWSSGKDSAWALKVLREADEVDVVGLLTTFNATHERVAMHAVRRQLAREQAAVVGLPLREVDLPWPCSNEVYETRMQEACDALEADGVERIAFGDLFLEDVRAYREKQLARTRLEPMFPIWGLETTELARTMIASGLRAQLTCIDPKALDPSFAGRAYDGALLADLPDGVDPCGERGEFHTFVWDGPMFTRPLAVATGEVVEREGFVFCDLTPKS